MFMCQLGKILLLSLLLIIVSTTLVGQTTVSGTITDGSTKQPLQGVNIVVLGSIQGTTTGSFTTGFQAEAPGDVTVVVRQSDLPRAQEVLAELENMKKDQGWLAASTDPSAAKSHSFTSLRPRGSMGISLSLSSPR